MVERLPSGVEVEALPDGARYVLPRRPLGSRVGRSLGALVAGLAMSGVWRVLFRHSWSAFPSSERSGCLGVLAWVVLSLLLLAGVWMLGVAFLRFFGRAQVEIRRGRIRAVERVLGIRFRTAGPDLDLVAAEVASLPRGRAELAFAFQHRGEFGAASGYPYPLVQDLARAITERHGSPSRAPAVPVPPPSAPRPVPRPPPGSPHRPGTGITFLPDAAPAPAKGECQVCSTGMTVDLVACATCRTLHHRACWDYMRRCSTYACRGARAVPAARREGEEEAVVVIAEEEGSGGRRRAGRKALREWLRTVAAEHRWGEVRSRERKHRHCEVSFPVGRLACVLEGRASAGRLEFRVRAGLPDAGLRQAASGLAVPPRSAWIERRVHADHLELLPRTAIDALPQLRGFVRGAFEILAAIGGTP